MLLLGIRGDLDPYRAEDIRELQCLLAAVSPALAYTASFAYHGLESDLDTVLAGGRSEPS